jgi:hypothetical protein
MRCSPPEAESLQDPSRLKIAAAHEIIVPIETQTMALSGVGLLMQNIEDLLIAEVLTVAPKIRAVATKHDFPERSSSCRFGPSPGVEWHPGDGDNHSDECSPGRVLWVEEDHLRSRPRRVGRGGLRRTCSRIYGCGDC